MRTFLHTPKILFSISIFCAFFVKAQISFTNKNSLLHSETGVLGSNGSVRSANSVAIVDINGDGLDDIIKLDGNRYLRIEYQQVGGTFTHANIGDFGVTSAWSMCVADVDHNGYKDVLYGGWGSGGARLMKLNATGTGMLGAIISLPGGSGISSQNANFMDVNNDGWEDIFVCNDVNESMIWANDGAGNFPAEQANSIINFNVTAGTAAPNDESGNYGSVWTDFDNDGDVDFYIAHCRQSYGPGDLRRTNVLFENNGNGTYTSNAAAHNLASNDQDWTASFGDIDNDGDFDLFMTKHDVTSRYYFNDGSGNFTISPNTIAFGSMPMQSQWEDYDNDGFLDLFISGDNDHRLYRNNQNGTFTNVTPTNLTAGKNILSFATGDLNHDGKIDIYASYGSTYNSPSNSIDDIYWQNATANNNHFLTLNLSASVSNKGALGARAFIYGAWGVQTREVRAGESYGTLNSFQLHFGLGLSSVVDSVVVNWPSGIQSVVVNPAVDQFLNVLEVNPCTLSSASVTTSGPTSFCSGGSVILTANSGNGLTYLWSNGATTQSITATTSGSYAVTITESALCNSTSSSIVVSVNPSQVPTVSASSTVVGCAGTVTLTSTAAASYLWSTGETTQSISVMSSGSYSVTIQGTCQAWTSAATSVSVLPTPLAPTGADVTISAPQSVALTATGLNDVWFSAMVGGTQLGTGNVFNTPIVFADTTFYVEDQQMNGGATGSVGQKYHTGTSNFSGNTTNAWEIFDVIAPCTLNTVKVFTDTPGNRLIELRNSGGTVLQSLLVNVPIDTSLITLNWALTPGTAYQLGTNSAQNNTSLTTTSPRLMRSNAGASYPYTLSGLVSITGSNLGSGLFYYFYDWQVSNAPVICSSPRHPQSVLFSTLGINGVKTENAISVYPNPATSFVNIKIAEAAVGATLIELTDLSGRIVSSVSVGSIKKGQIISYDITSVAKGVYLIKVRNGEKQSLQKLVIN